MVVLVWLGAEGLPVILLNPHCDQLKLAFGLVAPFDLPIVERAP